MDAETPDPLPAELFDSLRRHLRSGGPIAAADELIAALSDGRNPTALFYAHLLKSRIQLGVTPFPQGNASDLPAEHHAAYEEAIRSAARTVGALLLRQGDIPKAWPFFRLIGESGPVREALDSFVPDPDSDAYPLIDVAWHQGVHPRKGFELLLDRQGICSTITLLGGTDLSRDPELREFCLNRLATMLRDQLLERVGHDLKERGRPVRGTTLAERLDGQDDLFDEHVYHIDLSHLLSVVQMAMVLPPGPTLDLVADLCEYGRRLSANLTGRNDPPFDGPYADYLAYVNVVRGRDVDRNLDRFRTKAASEAANGNPFPAEVLVNLLVRIGRDRDALAVAKQYLSDQTDASPNCPSLVELATKVRDYAAIVDAARTQNDAVTFLAGLIADTPNPAGPAGSPGTSP